MDAPRTTISPFLTGTVNTLAPVDEEEDDAPLSLQFAIVTPFTEADTLPVLDMLDATKVKIPSNGTVYEVLLTTLLLNMLTAFA